MQPSFPMDSVPLLFFQPSFPVAPAPLLPPYQFYHLGVPADSLLAPSPLPRCPAPRPRACRSACAPCRARKPRPRLQPAKYPSPSPKPRPCLQVRLRPLQRRLLPGMPVAGRQDQLAALAHQPLPEVVGRPHAQPDQLVDLGGQGGARQGVVGGQGQQRGPALLRLERRLRVCQLQGQGQGRGTVWVGG